mgnify:CR=1 FL=1
MKVNIALKHGALLDIHVGCWMVVLCRFHPWAWLDWCWDRLGYDCYWREWCFGPFGEILLLEEDAPH